VQDDNLGATRRHFVVCGDTPLAYRLVEELLTQYEAGVTAIIPTTPSAWSDGIRRLGGVTIVESDRLDRDAFLNARLDLADALALADQEDAGNVDAALLAQEINPDIRIVIRMFNLGLGERMTHLLNNCAVLSAAAIAAPAFVAAALNDTSAAPIVVADRTLVAVQRESVSPSDIVSGLAIVEGRSEPETLPADEARTDLVLARTKPVTPRPPRRRHRRVRVLSVLMGARLRLVLLAFLLLYAAGTAVLAWASGEGLAQAAYVALLSEVGASADANATGIEKIVFIVLTLSSIALIPALTAAIVDSVVKARLRLEAGGLVEPIEDHMVVVGLGDVGTRVVRALNAAGVDVVAIERNPQARGVQVARDLGIPVIIGDASRNEILLNASVATCRALVVVSTDDVTNLETALIGRTAKPDLRVVLRIFDGEFAGRVKRAFNINHSRSVSYLAAPAFAAAMQGRQVVGTISVRRRVLLVADLPVASGSVLEHQPVSAVSRPNEVRLLAVRTADQVLWKPSEGRPLRSNDRVIAVATRAGLGHLLTDLTTQRANGNTPYRLLEPWEVPRHRPESAEGAGEHPPFGPTDAPSTRPA
jgi:Trk K+ transport system NAD-binding subunit